MKIITLTIQAVFIALMLGVAGLFLMPLLPIDNNIQLRIVESGSMEPNIMTGSLVLIVPAAEYKVGDVVTFTSLTADVPTTHRLTQALPESGEGMFVTKGDANEEADSAPVNVKDILGKVLLAVPFAGFVLDFARQPVGFALLIVLPALMIILNEIEKIWMEIKSKIKSKDSVVDEEGSVEDFSPVTASASLPVKMMDVGMPVQYRVLPTLDLRYSNPIVSERPAVVLHKNHYGQWATVFVAFLGSSIFVTASFLPYTASYFNDVERSIENVLKANMLDFTASTEENFYVFDGAVLDNIDSSVVTVVEPTSGSVDVKYDMRTEFMSGSEIFCNDILTDTSLPVVYTGPLLSLVANDVSINDPLSLLISLGSSTAYTSGEMCQVDIVYTAWNSTGNNGEGYSDEERVALTFSVPVTFAPLIFKTFSSTIVEEVSGTEDEKVVEEEVVEGEEEVINENEVTTLVEPEVTQEEEIQEEVLPDEQEPEVLLEDEEDPTPEPNEEVDEEVV